MRLPKLSQFEIFALLLFFSITSCKNKFMRKSSAEEEIRQMEQLQVQGILEQDSTIIRKILANELIVNALTKSNHARQIRRQPCLISNLLEHKLMNLPTGLNI